MYKNINCKYNDQSFCLCEKVKRGLFGFGWRSCKARFGEKCEYITPFPKPTVIMKPQRPHPGKK